MKIVHIISNLNFGGAEKTLFKLVYNDKDNNHVIINLTKGGFYKNLLKKVKIKVYDINIQKNLFFIFKIFKIIKILKIENPKILQTWMYHSDFLGSILGKICGVKYIFWNIRNSNLEKKWSNFFTLFLFRINSLLSWHFPDKIISCSANAIKYHSRNNYCKKKMVLISNGFDEEYFLERYINNKFIKYQKNQNFVSFGMIARWNPQKSHNYLITSIHYLNKKYSDWKLFLAGKNINYKNKKLVYLINKYKLNKKIYLLDVVKNPKNFYKICHFTILASRGNEGFPNVVGESMFNKVPVIATNSGDTKKIISKFGWVANLKLKNDLASKLKKAYLLKKNNNLGYKQMSKKANQYIKNKFPISKMIYDYKELWNESYD